MQKLKCKWIFIGMFRFLWEFLYYIITHDFHLLKSNQVLFLYGSTEVLYVCKSAFS